MKRIPVLLAVAVMLLLGCAAEKSGEAEDARGGTPIVYVSNYPLKYFADRIGAGHAQVRFPATASGDPAYWKPTPDDVVAMHKADLILLSGASYEKWLANVSLPPSRLIDTAAGASDAFIELEEEITHSHGPEGEHEHVGRAFTIWMDMTLAAEQAHAVKEAFAARWPAHKQQFEERFAALEKDLQTLDADFRAAVAANPDLRVVFSHPVYQYFARRYGVNGRSVHWEPDAMPDASMWSEMQDLLAEHSAPWILWEGEPLPEIAQHLADLGVRSVVVDPCGNQPEAGDFLSVMRDNAARLRDVYAGEIR